VFADTEGKTEQKEGCGKEEECREIKTSFRALLYLTNKVLSFCVPLGVGKRLQKWGVDKSKILEFGWWDEMRIGDIKIASTPARHYSGRYLLDKDFTFWRRGVK
jgi:L-ascorbate metabolism protein UlaG (beta-lactamase superfamily)